MEFNDNSGPLIVNFSMSIMASLTLFYIIPRFKDMFIAAGLSGIDMNKLPVRSPANTNKDGTSAGSDERRGSYTDLDVKHRKPIL